MQGYEFQNRAIVTFPSKEYHDIHVEIDVAINSNEKSLTLQLLVAFEYDIGKDYSN